MEFLEINDNNVIIKDNYENISIKLKENTSIKSSVLINYNSVKNQFYIFFVIGIVFTILNYSSNMVEKIVPKSQESAIFYQRGFDRYQIQPGGWGTSIYPVHIKSDGNFYYSQNLPVFFLFEVFIVFVFGTLSFVKYKQKERVETNFLNDQHTITLITKGIHLRDFVAKTFYVGNFNETKELFNKISKMIETIKLS
jgi:hypothetical protein